MRRIQIEKKTTVRNPKKEAFHKKKRRFLRVQKLYFLRFFILIIK